MTQQEDLTQTLASALWRSAFSPYSRALEDMLERVVAGGDETKAEAAAEHHEAPSDH